MCAFLHFITVPVFRLLSAHRFVCLCYSPSIISVILCCLTNICAREYIFFLSFLLVFCVFSFVGYVCSLLPMLLCYVSCICLLLILFISLLHVPGPAGLSLWRPCNYFLPYASPSLFVDLIITHLVSYKRRGCTIELSPGYVVTLYIYNCIPLILYVLPSGEWTPMNDLGGLLSLGALTHLSLIVLFSWIFMRGMGVNIPWLSSISKSRFCVS